MIFVLRFQGSLRQASDGFFDPFLWNGRIIDHIGMRSDCSDVNVSFFTGCEKVASLLDFWLWNEVFETNTLKEKNVFRVSLWL